MKDRRFIFVITFFLFSTVVFSQRNPNEHDTQVWNSSTVSFPLFKTKNKSGTESERIVGFIYNNIRAGFNNEHFVDERVGFGFEYKFNKRFSLSPSYLYRAAQPVKNRKEFEHRVMLDFIIEEKRKYFSVRDRNRLERRIRNSKDDITVYRNRIQLRVPIRNKGGKEIFATFIAEEPYYNFNQRIWFRNEFSVGISRKLTKKTSADFYYILQTNKNVNVLKKVDIIGVNLNFRIS